MSDASDDKRLRTTLQKARRVLRTAHLALEDDDADSAVNRAYYAAFYLASAALWQVGENPKTHKGTVDRFWVRFVREGDFQAKHAQALRTAFNARQKADYNFIGVHDTQAAADLLRDVKPSSKPPKNSLSTFLHSEELPE